MAAGTGFLLQEIERDTPFVLLAAMLAHDLINAPLDWLSEAEIVSGEGQDLGSLDDLEHPIRNTHLELAHATRRRLPHDFETVDQTKTVRRFLAIRLDVGQYPSAA